MAYKATLTGNLGRDPEVKYFENGTNVANFSVAVRSWRKDDPSRWVKVSVWGKSADYVSDNLRKGDKVCLIGRVDAPETFVGRDGATKIAEKFTAETVEKFSERKKEATLSQPTSQNCPMPSQAIDTSPSSIIPDDEEIPF